MPGDPTGERDWLRLCSRTPNVSWDLPPVCAAGAAHRPWKTRYCVGTTGVRPGPGPTQRSLRGPLLQVEPGTSGCFLLPLKPPDPTSPGGSVSGQNSALPSPLGQKVSFEASLETAQNSRKFRSGIWKTRGRGWGEACWMVAPLLPHPEAACLGKGRQDTCPPPTQTWGSGRGRGLGAQTGSFSEEMSSRKERAPWGSVHLRQQQQNSSRLLDVSAASHPRARGRHSGRQVQTVRCGSVATKGLVLKYLTCPKEPVSSPDEKAPRSQGPCPD